MSGVCISVWEKEAAPSRDGPWMDTRLHCDPIEGWAHKNGNGKRIGHLQQALEAFDGWVDVVIVHGTPGKSYGDATPWHPSQRRGARWRVEQCEPSGHFVVRVVPAIPSRD